MFIKKATDEEILIFHSNKYSLYAHTIGAYGYVRFISKQITQPCIVETDATIKNQKVIGTIRFIKENGWLDKSTGTLAEDGVWEIE